MTILKYNPKKVSRFLKPIEENKNFILFQSPNLNAKNTVNIRKNIEAANFHLKMTLKRLLSKVFFGSRERNVKTKFKGNLYMAIPQSNADYQLLIQVIKKQKCEIVGVVNDGKMASNYETYLMCEFDKARLIAILVKILLFPPLITLNYLTNKLTSK